MKVVYTISFLLSSTLSFAQRIPISPYTYENCPDIDNYFGETDSLILRYNIHLVKIFFKTNTERHYHTVTYNQGKKMRVEELDPKFGKLERTIDYTYSANVLDANINHYPSADNFNLFPASRFYYLERVKDNQFFRPYKRDTTTNIVKMHIRHTFKNDGTVYFEGFNKDEKLIDTFHLKPILTWEEFQKLPKPTFPKKIKTEQEEYVYDTTGKILSYKNTDQENKYFYDNRSLLIKEERFEYGKLMYSKLYRYE